MERLIVDYGTGRPDGVIPAAGTVVHTEEFDFLNDKDIDYVALYADYTNTGVGGTSIDARLQTSFDGGLTWCDIINCQVLAATLRKLGAVNKFIAAAAPAAPTDGTLAANTINNGLIGSKFRLKLAIVGAYLAADTYKVFVCGQRTK